MDKQISKGLRRLAKPAAKPGRGTFAGAGRVALTKDTPATIRPEGGRATALPSTIRLGFLRDGRLRVRAAIEVALREEDGQIIAAAEELNEFGSGDNQSAAIAELQRAIAELYFSLEKDKDRLGPGLQKVWDALQVKIERH